MLGIHMPNGRLAFLTQATPMTEDMVQAAKTAARTPEQRFRFSSPCLQKGCGQWTGSRCGVIDDVLVERAVAESAGLKAHMTLPDCAIRPSCRWFDQAGSMACAACPEIVTDMR
jgi:hypothetical protein